MSASEGGGWIARCVLAVVLFATGLTLFTTSNRFPYQYHPDEPSKVAQILTGERNLRHPLLLLSTTEMVVRVLHLPREPQAIAVAGRWVAATFAAAAVVVLALLAVSLSGGKIGAGWMTGVLVLCSRLLFELGHYFKEDTALLFGMALTWWAGAAYERKPGLIAAAALGAACGVAASGKYLGAAVLLFALAAVAFKPTRWRDAGVVLVSCAAVFGIINAPLLASPQQLSASLGYEMQHVTQGESGVAYKVPHGEYLGRTVQEVGGLVLVAALASLGLLLARRPRLPTALLLAGFAIGYWVMLSCSPKVAGRYALPVIATLYVLAGMAPALIMQRFSSLRIGVRFLELTLFVIAMMGVAISVRGFQQDHRADLVQWLAGNAPTGSIIAYETKVGLGWNPAWTTTLADRTLVRKDIAPDLGTLPEQRANGTRYVVTHNTTRHFYTSGKMAPAATAQPDYTRRRAFYEALDNECALVWKSKGGQIETLTPALRVYDLHQLPVPSKKRKQ